MDWIAFSMYIHSVYRFATTSLNLLDDDFKKLDVERSLFLKIK